MDKLFKKEHFTDSDRPSELTDEKINETISFVYQKYLEKDPTTYKSILHFLEERLNKDNSMKTLYGKLFGR